MEITENTIRAHRTAKGWSLQKLADACQTSKSQIDKLEKGQRRLTVEWMVRLSHPLECDPRDLISLHHHNTTPNEESLPIRRCILLNDKNEPDTFTLGEPIDQIPKPLFLAHTQDAYAIYVLGKSMSPMFRKGQLLLINPHKPPTPESGVILIKKDGTATLKAYTKRTKTTLHLKTFHPTPHDSQLKESEITEIHTITGTIDP